MSTTVEVIDTQPVDGMGDQPRYAAACVEHYWQGIPSLFRFYAEADARDHDAAEHGGAPRKRSSLIDGTNN